MKLQYIMLKIEVYIRKIILKIERFIRKIASYKKEIAVIANVGFIGFLLLTVDLFFSAWKTNKITININNHNEKYFEAVLLIVLVIISICIFPLIFIKGLENE